MRLKNLVINNLYSFGEGVLFTFVYNEENSKTLIVGQNNDESGADSNGAGKSNTLNVIFWTIIGEVFQKENADDIIRRGKKSGSAKLTLLDDNGKELVIERGRGKGTKKFLKLSYNGDNRTCDTDTATQAELFKLLNISPTLKVSEVINDFVNTCYFSSDTVKGFMAKEVKSKQRFEIIERYLGLKRYSYASEDAKKKKSEILAKINPILEDIAHKQEFLTNNPTADLEQQIIEKESEKSKLTSELDSVTKMLDSVRQRTELETLLASKNTLLDTTRSGFVSQLQNMKNEVATYDANIQQANEAVETYNKEKEVLDKAVIAITDVKINQQAINTEISNINSEVMKLNSTIGGLNNNIHNIKGQLANHYTCPKCKSALMLTNDKLENVDVDALAKQLVDLENKRLQISNTIKEHQEKVQNLTQQSNDLNNQIQKVSHQEAAFKNLPTPDQLKTVIDNNNFNKDEAVTKYNNTVTHAETTVGALKKEIEDLTVKVDALGKSEMGVPAVTAQSEKLKGDINTILTDTGRLTERITHINKTSEEIEKLQKNVSKNKALADMYGFWEIGFRQIKMNIIDEFLPDFEAKVNDYLERLKVNMSVEFGTQKRKANVSKKDIAEGREFKEEFNVTVYRGEELLPFGLLSKGQRSRVGSCVGMALREMTKERGNNLFDFFFLDEIADALDESGLRELVSLLDEVPGQKLVISHNEGLKNLIEDTLTVEMTNGISTVQN